MKSVFAKVLMLLLSRVVYWPLYLYSVLMCRYFGTSLNAVLEDNSRYVFANMDETSTKLFSGAKYALLLTYNEFSEKVESEVVVYHIHLGIIRYSGKQRTSFLTSLEQLESLF